MKCYNLSEDCKTAVCNESTQNVSMTNTLPSGFSGSPKYVFITVDNSATVTLDSWSPTGLCSGSIVRLQKISSNNSRVEYNDGVHQYNYLNKKGEIMTLVWSESDKLEII